MKRSLIDRTSIVGLIFAFFAFFALSFSTSTARMGGADEVLHHATAWYDTSHLLVTKEYNSVQKDIPLKVAVWPCFIFQIEKPSTCSLTKLPDDMGEMVVYNYFPLYYYFVGVGDRIGLALFSDYAWLGGRLLALLPVMMIMFLFLRRVGSSLNNFAVLLPLLIFTPQFISLIGTANPNGFEIMTALWFLIVLYDYLRGSDRSLWKLLLAEFLLIASRPMGVFWVLAIFSLLSIYGFYASNKSTLILERSKKEFMRIASTLLKLVPLLSGGLIWVLLHPLDVTMPPMIRPKGFTPATSFNFDTFPGFFVNSLALIPKRLNESYFMAGYKEIFSPWFLSVAIGLSIIYLIILSNKTLKNYIFTILLFIAFFITMSLIEAQNWGKWPEFWLGRYQLPILIPMLYILLKDLVHIKKWVIMFIINLFILGSIYSAYENFARYQVGIVNGIPNSFFLPNDFLGYLSYLLIACMTICGLLITVKTNKHIKNNWRIIDEKY